MKYSVDMRPILAGDLKIIHMPGEKPISFKYESDHQPNLFYEDLKEGMELCYWNPEKAIYEKVTISHVYGGVVFFKKQDGTEKWLGINSFGYHKYLYPAQIIIPTNVSVTSECPLTEIIQDDDMDHIYDGSVYRIIRFTNSI